MNNQPPGAMLLMKVGSHAGESFEEILKRKNKEYEKTGQIFWGYGGNACHPLKQVQPFVSTHVDKGENVYLVMQEIDSRANPTILPATHFSADGKTWEPIPKGINVTGSRYALVLDEIRPVDLEIPSEQYEVGIGPSVGRSAKEYMQGHVDKACLVRRDSTNTTADGNLVRSRFAAKLLRPYAVLVNHQD